MVKAKTAVAPKTKGALTKAKTTSLAKSKKANALTDDVLINAEDVMVTEEGYKKLKDELLSLETVKRREVAARLQEAIAYGDLSENSEYQEAKEEQAFTEGRILELLRKIKHAKIISDQHTSKVNLGSKVELQNITLKEKENYTIVGSTEVDPFAGKISNESPLGDAMLGKKEGYEFTLSAPEGKYDYKVVKIS